MPIANCTHSVLRHCRGLDQRSTNRQATKRPQWSQPVGVWARKSKARHAAQCGPPVPLYAVGIIFWGGCQNCKEIGQCKKIWWRGSPSHHLILAKHIQCGKAAKVPDCCSDIFICNLCIVFMSKKMIKNDTIWHPCTKKWHQGRAVNFGLVNNGKHKWKINNTGLVSCDGEFITYHIHKIYIDRNVDVITVFWKHIEKPTCLDLVWHHLSLTYLQFFLLWSNVERLCARFASAETCSASQCLQLCSRSSGAIWPVDRAPKRRNPAHQNHFAWRLQPRFVLKFMLLFWTALGTKHLKRRRSVQFFAWIPTRTTLWPKCRPVTSKFMQATQPWQWKSMNSALKVWRRYKRPNPHWPLLHFSFGLVHVFICFPFILVVYGPMCRS